MGLFNFTPGRRPLIGAQSPGRRRVAQRRPATGSIPPGPIPQRLPVDFHPQLPPLLIEQLRQVVHQPMPVEASAAAEVSQPTRPAALSLSSPASLLLSGLVLSAVFILACFGFIELLK